MSDAVASIVGALRADGQRVTAARRLVIEALAGTDGAGEHLSAAEIATRVRQARPEIHLSTVYRTLESFRAWGFIDHVHQRSGPSFFQLSGTHHHVACELCGRIHDVPTSEFDELIARLRDAYGFELQIGSIALVGRCRHH